MENFTNIGSKFLRVSYLTNLRIVNDGKPHTISDTLVLLEANVMEQIASGEKAAK